MTSTDSAVAIELTYNKHLIQLRRSKVLELWSKGYSQERIAHELGVSQPLISLDIQWIQSQGREEMDTFISKLLPNTIKRALTTLNLITLEAWDTVESAKANQDHKTKLEALKVIQSAESDKIDIVSNIDIVNKLIGIVETKQSRSENVSNSDIGIEEEEAEENTSGINTRNRLRVLTQQPEEDQEEEESEQQ